MTSRLAIRSALAAGTLAVGLSGPAFAADLGGDCCADLEERVAELEATAARKGNRKVSLTVSGAVHRALLFWDDGVDSDVYVVDNKNDQTNINFIGEASVSTDVTAGYEITIRFQDALGDSVSQLDDEGQPDSQFQIWKANWYIDSKTLGRITLGQASRVSDTAPEQDLSETAVAAYAGVQDIGGSFFIRGDGIALGDGPVWGDLISHFNGDTADVIRYDTPEWNGFIAAASFGENDIWDVGLRYEGEFNSVKLAAAIAYTEVSDTDGDFADIDNETLVGSFSVLHVPTGLNFTLAAGEREFAGLDANGLTPQDASFIYGKLGLLRTLNALGPTGFYGEYGLFEDIAGADDPALNANLDNIGGTCTADDAPADSDCRLTSSEAEVWGFGVVQHIEAAEMQFYAGFRQYSAEFELADSIGAVNAGETEDFYTVIAGSKINF